MVLHSTKPQCKMKMLRKSLLSRAMHGLSQTEKVEEKGGIV